MRLETGEEPLERFATRGAEEVARRDLVESAAQAADVGGQRGVVGRALAAGGARLHQSPRRRCQLAVVGLARRVEERLDLVVAQPVHEARLADGGLAAVRDSSRRSHSKSSRVSGRFGSDVDRVLDRDGPERLQPAPDPHPEVARLRGQLVDQEQPADRWAVGHAGVVT